MAEKIDLYYDSKDGVSQIHATQWLPEERQPKAILQIVHGMQEYIDRYDAFARYAADRGFIVVGEDHLGHGSSVNSPKDFGYFAKQGADTILVNDIRTLKKMTESEFPGLPYYIYGFSMGSFITRKYLSMYGEGLDGAIIGGTGWKPVGSLNFGILLARLITLFKGDHYRSKLIDNIAFGKYLDKIEKPRTQSDWLSHDEKIVNAYLAEEKCTFKFTTNGFETLFKIIKYVEQPENARRVPPNLPVLFMSGIEDPVGDYGEGVKKAAELYMKNGMNNVSIKLYDGMRHEMHNEVRKHIVYLDILEWIENNM